jgi:hypothetical protein
MLFQTFDEKNKCSLIYRKGSFSEQIGDNCTQTWSYATYLRHKEVEYANLYTGGESLETLCPEGLKGEWSSVQARIKAALKAANEVGLNLDEHCVYEIIPRHYLQNFAEIKNKICEDVFNNHPKPQNYDQLLKINKVIADIRLQKVNIDPTQIERLTVQDRNMFKTISQCRPYIEYDMFKTVTGRLATKPNSFPVMTLPKKYRQVLTPTNDWLFELDFNACELRVALALLGHDQPKEDLHDWNMENVFTRTKSRENAKKRIFSWLYNPNSTDDKVDKIYDRKILKDMYYDKVLGKVYTQFGREIDADEDHALNYIIQSTAADLVFEQMYKVWKFLEGKKSFIKFCNHDSLVIDLSEEDQYDINKISKLFSNTRFGKFKVNHEGGKNWAQMKPLSIK